MNVKVKELPLDDRPREKLLLRGVQNLSNAELLAILLRTGKKGKSVIQLAQELLTVSGNLSHLATKSSGALQKIAGIGKDKAATLLAAFELSRRITMQSRWFSDKTIRTPEDVATIFSPMLRDEVREHFLVVCLNSANKILRYDVLSIGSLDMSIVHPREVFKIAIDNNAKSLILVHNHPSGSAEASKSDIAITKRLSEAGKILDIKIFDHIIIAGENYLSFVDQRFI